MSLNISSFHTRSLNPIWFSNPRTEDIYAFKYIQFPYIQHQIPKSLYGLAILGQELSQTPSIAFRHPPPNSARIGYATEGALFISAQLSTNAVIAL